MPEYEVQVQHLAFSGPLPFLMHQGSVASRATGRIREQRGYLEPATMFRALDCGGKQAEPC